MLQKDKGWLNSERAIAYPMEPLDARLSEIDIPIRTLAFGTNTPTAALGQSKAKIEDRCLRIPSRTDRDARFSGQLRKPGLISPSATADHPKAICIAQRLPDRACPTIRSDRCSLRSRHLAFLVFSLIVI